METPCNLIYRMISISAIDTSFVLATGDIPTPALA
jgi:hypothetical protein